MGESAQFPKDSAKLGEAIIGDSRVDGGVPEAADRGTQTFDRLVPNPERFRQGVFQGFALALVQDFFDRASVPFLRKYSQDCSPIL